MTQYVAKRAPVDIRLPADIKRALALSAFAGVFLAAAGAFDTEAAALFPRLAYWVLISLISTAGLEGCHRLLRRWSGQRSELRLRYWGLASLLLPMTVLALLMCKMVFGGHPKVADFLALLPGMVGILVALQLALANFPSSPARQQPMPQHRLLINSLPVWLRDARIDALQAEDHYVRVYTSAGQALVRMRLRDAVETIDGRAGFMPHRSWWVAKQSVIGFRRKGGGGLLTLVGGEQVPVSRAFARDLGRSFGAGDVPDNLWRSRRC